MTLQEAIRQRHSVRRYRKEPLSPEQVDALQKKISEINAGGAFHFQLVTGEPKAFTGLFAYGKFSGVENYIGTTKQPSDFIADFGMRLFLNHQEINLQRFGV